MLSGEAELPWRDLDHLVDKINGLGLKPHWKLEMGDQKIQEAAFSFDPSGTKVTPGRVIANPAVRHLGPDQKILRLRQLRWIVRERYPATAPVRKRVYWTIISALENGELAKLRPCPTCKTYFFAAHLKRRFCSQRCKDEFFNLEKAKTGYFKENREQRKKNRIRDARKLLDKDKSEHYVMEELGITRKALERARLIQGV